MFLEKRQGPGQRNPTFPDSRPRAVQVVYVGALVQAGNL